LLDRNLAGLAATQDVGGLASENISINLHDPWAVAQQSTLFGDFGRLVYRGKPIRREEDFGLR
jgi:hypothetical protein